MTIEDDIRKAAAEGRIELCSTALSDEYDEEIDEIMLRVFKIRRYLVTDESRGSDFAQDGWAARCVEAFGIETPADDALLVDVAAAIRRHKAS